MSKKIIVILVVVLIIILGGVYFYSNKSTVPVGEKVEIPISNTSTNEQNTPTVTQKLTCANNPNGYGVIYSSDSSENSDLVLKAGDKNVNLGKFIIEACSYLNGGIMIAGDSKNVFSTNIENFKNLVFIVDGKQIEKSKITGKNFDIFNFTMNKGQISNFSINADVVSSPIAMESNIGVFGTFGVVVSPNKQAGEATSNIGKDSGFNLRKITINSSIKTSQCSPNTKEIIITNPASGAISPLGVGDKLTLSWVPCNLPTGISYEVIISNPVLTTPDQEEVLWSGTETSASVTLKEPLDGSLNVIEVSAKQNGVDIPLKGNKNSVFFKKK